LFPILLTCRSHVKKKNHLNWWALFIALGKCLWNSVFIPHDCLIDSPVHYDLGIDICGTVVGCVLQQNLECWILSAFVFIFYNYSQQESIRHLIHYKCTHTSPSNESVVPKNHCLFCNHLSTSLMCNQNTTNANAVGISHADLKINCGTTKIIHCNQKQHLVNY
jgi:hypothetical protein